MSKEPRVLLTAPPTSSYSDGSSYIGINSALHKGAGVWLKPGERLAVLPPTPEEIAPAAAGKENVAPPPVVAKPPKAEPGDSIWVQPSVLKTKKGEVKIAGLTLREHLSGPVFTVGQKVVCISASGYHYLEEGEIYEVAAYDPPDYTPTFTWPAYATINVKVNGRMRVQRGHASRFRAIMEASDVGLP